jgi:hypothetical protein
MQISPYIDALQHDLAVIAEASDAAASDTVRRFSTALEAAMRLRLLEAVSEAAREIGTQIPGGHVEVRLAASDPSLVYVEDSRQPSPGAEDELSARISLRLPESLKSGVESAASREGLSVNSWIVRALTRGIEDRQRKVGKRLSGFARS